MCASVNRIRNAVVILTHCRGEKTPLELISKRE